MKILWECVWKIGEAVSLFYALLALMLGKHIESTGALAFAIYCVLKQKDSP